MERVPRLGLQPAIYLSARERQVLDLICRGRGHKQIAAELEIAAGSVRDVASRLYRKLQVADHRELMVWAFRHPEDVRTGITRDPGLVETVSDRKAA